mgnify:CR=1 FL=1
MNLQYLLENKLTTQTRIDAAKRLSPTRLWYSGLLVFGEYRREGRIILASINLSDFTHTCSCEDHAFHKANILCKHTLAVLRNMKKEEVETQKTKAEETHTVYISSGCPSIDQVFSVNGKGFVSRMLAALYSDYNVGKSILAIQVACHAFIQTGKPALVIDTEMNFVDEEARQRIVGWFEKRWSKELDGKPVKIDFVFKPNIYKLYNYVGSEGRKLHRGKDVEEAKMFDWVYFDALKEMRQVTRGGKTFNHPVYYNRNDSPLLNESEGHSIVILDSLSQPVKEEMPTPPNQNFPARAACENHLLGRLVDVANERNVPVLVTNHLSTAPEDQQYHTGNQYGGGPVGYHFKYKVRLKGPEGDLVKDGYVHRDLERERGVGLPETSRSIKLVLNKGYEEY